jgi:hypothetical protein
MRTPFLVAAGLVWSLCGACGSESPAPDAALAGSADASAAEAAAPDLARADAAVVRDAAAAADVAGHTDAAPADVGAIELDRGLIGRWTFDEGAGTTLHDSSGHGLDAEIRDFPFGDLARPAAPGAIGWLAAGHRGGALRLTGTQAAIVGGTGALPTLDRPSRANRITIAAWVRIAEHETSERFSRCIAGRSEAGTAYPLAWLALNHDAPASSVHFSSAVAGAPLELGRWTHLATTYDGTTIGLYQDGREITHQESGWVLEPSTTPFVIGAAQALEALRSFLHGDLDELRLYDRALSEAEIARLAAE